MAVAGAVLLPHTPCPPTCTLKLSPANTRRKIKPIRYEIAREIANEIASKFYFLLQKYNFYISI